MKKINLVKDYSRLIMGLIVIVLFSVYGWNNANAAATNISTAPIFTSVPATEEVKPNVMFVLDDSGSMGWRVMPDEAWNFTGRKGELASQCNGVFYDPNVTYTPPVRADGSSYPDASWPNAYKDGYNTSRGTVDLTSQFWWYYYSDTGAANYYIYNGSQTLPTQKTYNDTGSTFYQECIQDRSTNSSAWTHVVVNSTSGIGGTDERINFANWFSYYRTRMLTMKTSAGRAFNQLDDHYRIGFLTLNNSSPSNDFLNISDFDATQKTSWYDMLYRAVASGGTPLRESLAEAGLVYSGRANRINGVDVTDPVQFACQQNYTILSTDGYWNGNGGFKIDRSSIGNQDDLLPLPYNDGAFFSKTIVTPYTSIEDRQTLSSGYTTTETYQDTSYTIGAACSTPDTLTPPSNTTGIYLNIGNSRVAALGQSASNPLGSGRGSDRCYNLGSDAWFCRERRSGEGTPVHQSTVTSNVGDIWYLVTNGANNNPNCVSAQDAFGNSYDMNRGVCKATTIPGITGKEVTATPSTYTRTITGATTSVVDRYIATQTTTREPVTPTSSGTLGPLTPATPTFVFDSQISNSSTAGTASPYTTPVVGTATTTCVATASLPSAGSTGPVLISSVNSGGTSSTTVISTSGPTVGTPVETVNSKTAGTENTLADVAAYYYNTNLREWDGTGSMPSYCAGPIPAGDTQPRNLCLSDKVPPTTKDPEQSQHMTTFTLGLGAQGKMTFIPDYETNNTGDYWFVAKGILKSASTCSWSDTLTVTGQRCNWPVPVGGTSTTIDDLWHAAINGHGDYFNASDTTSLTTALTNSLNVIVNTPQPGTASAAATTSPQITSTNNYRFSSYFKSVEWSGELIRQEINLVSGLSPLYNHANPDPASYDWSAQALLDAKAYASRNIYTKSDATNTRIPFTWANLSAAQKAYFQAPHITTAPPSFPNQLTGLSQFCATTGCLSAADQVNAQGQPLVDFIRGDTSNEDSTTPDPTKYYRNRKHILGDIIGAEPIYVGPPDFDYTDTGYSTFKASNASRKALVYAAANDGMLHAFDADTGQEDWAYIPSFVLPRLYTLADKKYETKHQFFVEGTPASGDIYDASTNTWKSILVGGLNAGGVGYYALDITDPADPKVLWEFTDTDMGYTFGNPNIVRLDNGAWAVTFTSGYNNCPTSVDAKCAKNGVGDGQGHLYVINAVSGNLLSIQANIATGAGSQSDPSGLARTIVVGLSGNGTTESAYGGDLLGNLWRFDFGSAGYTKQVIATLKDPSGNPQPITAAPEASKVDGYAVVYVGTGRYLGTNDVDYTQTQSFYAIKDTGVSYGNPRSASNASNFIKYTAVSDTCPADAPVNICQPGTATRSITQATGTTGDNLQNKSGWYVDFPTGEITFTDPLLVSGTIAFTTSLPKSTSTEVCGNPSGDDAQSFLWQLNFIDGRTIGGYNVAATFAGMGISTRPKYMGLPNADKLATKNSDGSDFVTDLKTAPVSTTIKRNSWRELIVD